jgi:hypothetical protein
MFKHALLNHQANELTIILSPKEQTSKYCGNISGLHNNNQSFLLLRLRDRVIFQRCFCSCPPKNEGGIRCSKYFSEGHSLGSIAIKNICAPVIIDADVEAVDNVDKTEESIQTMHFASSKYKDEKATVVNIASKPPTEPVRHPLDSVVRVLRSPKYRSEERLRNRDCGANRRRAHTTRLKVMAHIFHDSISVRAHVPKTHPMFARNAGVTHELLRIACRRHKSIFTDNLLCEKLCVTGGSLMGECGSGTVNEEHAQLDELLEDEFDM